MKSVTFCNSYSPNLVVDCAKRSSISVGKILLCQLHLVALLALFASVAAPAHGGFATATQALASVTTYNSRGVQSEQRDGGVVTSARVLRDTQPPQLAGTGSFGEAFSVVDLTGAESMLAVNVLALEGLDGYPPVFASAVANVIDTPSLINRSGGPIKALVDDPSLYLTFRVHGFLAARSEGDRSEIRFDARALTDSPESLVQASVSYTPHGIDFPVATNWLPDPSPKFSATFHAFPEVGSSAVDFEFTGFYKARLPARFITESVAVFPYQAVMSARADAFAKRGFAKTDASNTVSLFSVTFSDGSTPESHGLNLTFASGMRFVNHASPGAAVPEPSTLVMLSTLALTGVFMARFRKQANCGTSKP